MAELLDQDQIGPLDDASALPGGLGASLQTDSARQLFKRALQRLERICPPHEPRPNRLPRSVTPFQSADATPPPPWSRFPDVGLHHRRHYSPIAFRKHSAPAHSPRFLLAHRRVRQVIDRVARPQLRRNCRRRPEKSATRIYGRPVPALRATTWPWAIAPRCCSGAMDGSTPAALAPVASLAAM